MFSRVPVPYPLVLAAEMLKHSMDTKVDQCISRGETIQDFGFNQFLLTTDSR
mgnify:CR=1 FL=1